MQYESNPKHSEPWQAGRKGSLCPKNLKPLALELLMKSEQVGRERFVFHEGKADCAKEHARMSGTATLWAGSRFQPSCETGGNARGASRRKTSTASGRAIHEDYQGNP